MLKKGYNRCNFDHYIYFKETKNSLYIYLLIYVDDMLIACGDKAEIQKLKLLLKAEFEMQDIGAAKRILGIDILRLSQAGYLKKVVTASL